MMSVASTSKVSHVSKFSVGSKKPQLALAFAPSLKLARSAERAAFLSVRADAVQEKSADKPVEESAGTPEAVPVQEPIVQAAESIGLNTSEGLFGFTPFAELWTGRLAMSGFTIGLVTEVITGKGILQQVGVSDGYADPNLFTLLVLLMGGASLAATTKTVIDIGTGNMSSAQLKNYAQGFGLTSEQTARLDRTEETMKEDEVSSSMGTMDEGSMDEGAPVVTPEGFEYGKYVEISNGRWAMIGFATAILIEAATGNGILPQLIGYGKASGLLGPESGF